MSYRPRTERERDRIQAAGVAAKPGGVLDMALAQIGAAFDGAAAVNGYKLRVEHLLRLGPRHSAVRARLGARAQMFSAGSLDAAIAVAERWWRDERKAFQIASALGYGDRLSLEVLRELRLLLRLLRFNGMAAEFGAIVVALSDQETPMAAE